MVKQVQQSLFILARHAPAPSSGGLTSGSAAWTALQFNAI
jgi:hypothetical protein